MLNPNTKFTPRITAPDANYPYGSAKNVATSGDDTGTPFVADLVNDMFGLQQSLLTESGITPSGTPDNIINSDSRDALRAMCGAVFETLTGTGVRALVASSTVKVGQLVATMGSVAAGDGLGAFYEIVAAGTGSVGSGEYVNLPNADGGSGLQAHRVAMSAWQLSTEVAAAIGGCGLGDLTALDISNGGEYHSTGATTISSAMTPTNDTAVRVKAGNLTITGTISAPALTLDVDGDLSIGAALTITGPLVIRCSGTLSQTVAVTAGSVTIESFGAGTVSNTLTAGDIEGLFHNGLTLTSTMRALVAGSGASSSNNSAANGSDGTGDYAGTGGTGATSTDVGFGAGGGGATGGGAGGAGGGGTTGGSAGGGKASAPVNRPHLMKSSTGGGGGSGSETGAGETGDGGDGGGSIRLFVEGDATMTGGTLDASGQAGAVADEGNGAGGGGGGTCKFACTGTITDGTYKADGGAGAAGDGADGGGGGGAGCVGVSATAESGTLTLSAAGGALASLGTAGSAGTTTKQTSLTATQVECLREYMFI